MREVGAMRPRSKFYTLETEITDFAPVYFNSSIWAYKLNSITLESEREVVRVVNKEAGVGKSTKS